MQIQEVKISDLKMTDYNQTIFVCQSCGKEFKSRKACRSRIPKFCSHVCYSKNLLGKPSKSNTTFRKGHVTWCKGKHHSKETKLKISKNKERALNISHALIGKKLSDAHRLTLSLAKKGKPIKHLIEYWAELKKLWEISGRLIFYGQEWRKLRRNTLKEKPFCARCGINKNLDIHHIIPFRISKSNNFDNLEVLCRSCHRIVEFQQLKMYKILKDWVLISVMVKAELNTKRRFYCDVIRQRYENFVSENVRK